MTLRDALSCVFDEEDKYDQDLPKKTLPESRGTLNLVVIKITYTITMEVQELTSKKDGSQAIVVTKQFDLRIDHNQIINCDKD
ncbi:hypothetical protein M8C21_022117 [Ambrosia artemisiifolia]|uniref:Uncharacterized protein n=1 Tax=Ambrosia artemisiifolia TaxID=4212 RepID=A0AAD5G205_AMBAR|nr:hypothetical protein M8C21_022117 [Ambrosia artemisiifolia]